LIQVISPLSMPARTSSASSQGPFMCRPSTTRPCSPCEPPRPAPSAAPPSS
jgi:hypothetical protein